MKPVAGVPRSERLVEPPGWSKEAGEDCGPCRQTIAPQCRGLHCVTACLDGLRHEQGDIGCCRRLAAAHAGRRHRWSRPPLCKWHTPGRPCLHVQTDGAQQTTLYRVRTQTGAEMAWQATERGGLPASAGSCARIATLSRGTTRCTPQLALLQPHVRLDRGCSISQRNGPQPGSCARRTDATSGRRQVVAGLAAGRQVADRPDQLPMVDLPFTNSSVLAPLVLGVLGGVALLQSRSVGRDWSMQATVCAGARTRVMAQLC